MTDEDIQQACDDWMAKREHKKNRHEIALVQLAWNEAVEWSLSQVTREVMREPIVIGDYSIGTIKDNNGKLFFWFQHKSGEGMSIGPDDMDKIFQEFM